MELKNEAAILAPCALHGMHLLLQHVPETVEIPDEAQDIWQYIVTLCEWYESLQVGYDCMWMILLAEQRQNGTGTHLAQCGVGALTQRPTQPSAFFSAWRACGGAPPRTLLRRQRSC